MIRKPILLRGIGPGQLPAQFVGNYREIRGIHVEDRYELVFVPSSDHRIVAECASEAHQQRFERHLHQSARVILIDLGKIPEGDGNDTETVALAQQFLDLQVELLARPGA
jgi:hypothetical protein